MARKAYISFEGEDAKICIPENEMDKSAFFRVESERVISFIKEKRVTEVSLTHFAPEFLSFSFPLAFTPETIPKKGILDNLVKVEINRRQLVTGNYAFSYEMSEVSGKVQLRVYVVGEKQLEIVADFIKEGIDVSSFFPFFMPLMEFVRRVRGDLEGDFIICFISGDMRYLYVSRDREMILQRSFQGSEGRFTDEDTFNINATINYAIQSLRLKPEKLFLIGLKEEVSPDIYIPWEVISIESGIEDFLMCYLLAQFEVVLKGKEFLPSHYMNYKKVKKIVDYTTVFLICLICILSIWDAGMVYDTVKLRNTLMAQKREISSREAELFSALEYIKRFESTVKPVLDLRNRKNSVDDIREALFPVAEASRIAETKVATINIENGKPQKILITGHVPKSAFFDRQLTYMQFRNTLLERRLKIVNEKWSFVSGEFHIEGTYDAGGTPEH